MAKPKLFGISGSRALRSLWAIEEVGIDYEHVPVTYGADSKQASYLSVNPNGRVPALSDGELHLFESMAINLYLAKTYGGALYPSTAADEAQAWQWSVWGISELEPLQMQIVVQMFFTPEEKRNPKAVEGARKGLQRPLKVLDAALAGRRLARRQRVLSRRSQSRRRHASHENDQVRVRRPQQCTTLGRRLLRPSRARPRVGKTLRQAQ